MRLAPGFLFLVLIAVCSAFAQTVGASIQGTVTDSTGALIDSAKVTVRNVGTGSTKDIATDNAARYHLPLLQPGEYEVQVSAPGFQTASLKGIKLAVGEDRVLDVALSPGQISSTVTVLADTSGVNTTSSALSGLVNDRLIRDLPLNSRSFQQLALLQPGVMAAVTAGSDVVGGRTPKISINGARPEQNSFLLDGIDIDNTYNKTPGSVGGVLLGVEAIREFQVLTNAYSAEFGKSAGGVINVVTRAGTNDFHGTAFEFLRNSALDAKNYFDRKSDPIPSFKRNQFGGAIGGRLRKDKTFFFAAYESLIERLGITGLISVPDDNARQGILPGQAPFMVNSQSAVLVDKLFPHANGSNLGGGVAEYFFSRTQPTDEHFIQGRIDHHFSERDTLFGRYTFDNGKVNRWSASTPPNSFTKERSRNQYVTIEMQHTFSPRLLNIARIGFNRSTQQAQSVRTVELPESALFVPGEPMGFITIRGVASDIGGDVRLPRFDRFNNYQWGDTLFLTKGPHALRLGFQGQRIQFNQYSLPQLGGIATFNNLTAFLKGQVGQFDWVLPQQQDGVRGYRQWFWAMFGQEDYKLRPNVTVNLGLRYETVTVPTEVNGKVSNLRNVTDSKITVGDPWHSNPSKRNFAPRIGVAWDPLKDGKTSVRAGFGIFYDEILPKYYIFSGAINPPFSFRSSLTNVTLPLAPLIASKNPGNILPVVQTINFDLQSPYVMQYNFTVQRALPGKVDVTIGYVGSRGNHLIRVGEANLAPFHVNQDGRTVFDGTTRDATGQNTCCRRNPNFLGIFQRITDTQSFYNSLQLSIIKRYSHGLRAQLSYTFSHSVDDASGINSQDFNNNVQYVSNWYERKTDRGLSAFAVQHNLTMNWTYDLPLANSATGAKAAFLKGWQLNNIVTLASGPPFTVRLGSNRSGNLNTTSFSANDRPDIVPGINPVIGRPDQYLDITAFALPPVNTQGNLGRNTIIGPGLVAIDASVSKTFQLSEGRTLQFRTEVFNLPNHPNFAIPSGLTSFTNATGAVSPTFGRITSTTTTSRQIQFGLKLNF
ncbi:MAG TPA: carboxypeptidase regulatory-like domain-containing protein [Pyrinomonadaceae bacterium]|nr:carboxypeptidase regulatory-like domain-containing protein [Pyrinomonadaceae bacterium]